MAKNLIKLSILLPILFVCYAILRPFAVYIPRVISLNQRTLPTVCFIIFIVFMIFLKKDKGNIYEVLTNILPVMIILTLVYAQHHPRRTLAIVLIAVALVIVIRRDASIKTSRAIILLSAILMIYPSMVSLIVYHLEPPIYYDAGREVVDRFLSEIIIEKTDEEIPDFIRSFRKEEWKRLSIEKKIELAQKLVDYETSSRLIIPDLDIVSTRMENLLGKYEQEENRILIDIDHLTRSESEDVIRSLCHEAFHACQYYIIDSFDWEKEDITRNIYFAEARDWYLNCKNYVTWDYEMYKKQPLEKSARKYAEEEAKRLLEYIDK